MSELLPEDEAIENAIFAATPPSSMTACDAAAFKARLALHGYIVTRAAPAAEGDAQWLVRAEAALNDPCLSGSHP